MNAHGSPTTGTRWCAACNRKHGQSFICASYTPDIVALIKTEEQERDTDLLPFGVPGNGVSQLVGSTRRQS